MKKEIELISIGKDSLSNNQPNSELKFKLEKDVQLMVPHANKFKRANHPLENNINYNVFPIELSLLNLEKVTKFCEVFHHVLDLEGISSYKIVITGIPKNQFAHNFLILKSIIEGKSIVNIKCNF